MKSKLLSLAFILCFFPLVFGQITQYSGVVKDHEGYFLLGVNIELKGSKIKTTTNLDGAFSIAVPESFDTLVFSYIGYKTLEYKLDGASPLLIVMEEDENSGYFDIVLPLPTGPWISIGSFSDIQYAPFGIAVSNGQDEEYLLHFEDFQAKVSGKLSAATDFNENFTLEAKGSIRYLRIESINFHNTSLEYIHKDYSNVRFRDYSVSTQLWMSHFWFPKISLKIGVQELNNKSGFGGAIGYEGWGPYSTTHYSKRFQYGAQIGYWNDYFTYQLYIRSFIYKRTIGLMFKYNRMDRYDFFTVGLHYLFKTWEADYSILDNY